jgi:hypothetical protein
LSNHHAKERVDGSAMKAVGGGVVLDGFQRIELERVSQDVRGLGWASPSTGAVPWQHSGWFGR